MASLTEAQAAHYKTFFNRYSERYCGYITAEELFYIMPYFGRELSLSRTNALVEAYGRNGTCNFEEFLQLLQDYELCLDEERSDAQQALERVLKNLSANGKQISMHTLEEVLKSGADPLSDTEASSVLQELGQRFNFDGHMASLRAKDLLAVQEESGQLAWIAPETKQSIFETTAYPIRLRIMRIVNLSAKARVKYRRGQGIEFRSLDPLLAVVVDNQTIATTPILTGHTEAEWNVDVVFTVNLPSIRIHEAQPWIQAQELHLLIFDACNGGVVPHMEWVGKASVPLTAILRQNVGLSDLVEVPLVAPFLDNCDDSVQIEFSLERLPTPGTGDSIPLCTELLERHEEILRKFFTDKIERDLARGLARNAAEEAGDSGLFNYYTEFVEQTMPLFRRRNIRILGLDETDTFRLMCTFLRPTSFGVSEEHVQSREDAARAVSRLKNCLHEGIPSVRTRPPPLQILSPWNILYRGVASPLEASIILCNMFLYQGVDAYVAVGNCSAGCECCWVVSIDTVTSEGVCARSSPGASEPTDRSATFAERSQCPPSNYAANPDNEMTQPKTAISREAVKGTATAALREKLASLRARMREQGRAKFRQTATAKDRSTKETAGEITNRKLLRKQSRAAIPISREDLAARRDRPTVDGAVSVSVLGESTGEDSRSPRGSLHAINSPRHSRRPKSFLSEDRSSERSGEPGDAQNKFVTHWNPVTGEALTDDSDPAFPFKHIGSLFNDRNIWLNVSLSGLTEDCLWDLLDESQWLPFLCREAAEEYGQVVCWYDDFDCGEIRALSEPPMPSQVLAQELLDAIRLYRRNVLYVPETRFQRDFSQVLQQSLQDCEEAWNTRDPSFLESIERQLQEDLPDHAIWHGIPIHFKTPDISTIMQKLVWSGILDVTVPQATYVLAARVFRHPLRLVSVWVWVGYLIDLNHIVKQ